MYTLTHSLIIIIYIAYRYNFYGNNNDNYKTFCVFLWWRSREFPPRDL